MSQVKIFQHLQIWFLLHWHHPATAHAWRRWASPTSFPEHPYDNIPSLPLHTTISPFKLAGVNERGLCGGPGFSTWSCHHFTQRREREKKAFRNPKNAEKEPTPTAQHPGQTPRIRSSHPLLFSETLCARPQARRNDGTSCIPCILWLNHLTSPATTSHTTSSSSPTPPPAPPHSSGSVPTPGSGAESLRTGAPCISPCQTLCSREIPIETLLPFCFLFYFSWVNIKICFFLFRLKNRMLLVSGVFIRWVGMDYVWP